MRFYVALILPILIAVAVPASGQSQAFVSVKRTNRQIAGTVVDYTNNHGKDRRVFSPLLGMPRDLYVYLPPGYSPCNAYPLILYFHGGFGDEHAFIEGDRIKFLDWAIQQGWMPPVVVACADGIYNGKNRILAPHSLYVNGCGGPFEDHIMGEVLPFLLSTYSIRPERQAHAILGLSAGGVGAVNLAIRHRDFFGSVAVLAAALNLRYYNCHCDYMEDFDPATYRWRTRYIPNEVIGVFGNGLIRLKAKRFIEPIFGSDPGVVDRMAAQNPIEQLLAANLAPGELPMYVNYAGRDNLNFDAQAESFVWMAVPGGHDLTVESSPSSDHSIDYFRETQKRAYLWLANHLLPPVPRQTASVPFAQ